MPFDSFPEPIPAGVQRCPSCKQGIAAHQPTELLRFEREETHRLDELNGLYHAECAQPYLAMTRTLDVLNRAFG